MADKPGIVNIVTHDKRHGGPYDRGSADKYYGRPKSPHYYKGDTYQSEKVEAHQMSDDEIAAYHAGYDGEDARKDWG